jgi:DNA-binding LytR/AlgR family response regulator
LLRRSTTPRFCAIDGAMKCLVVDDDPLVCATVEQFLGRVEGIEYCLQANDGLIALNLLSADKFDLVFLDLQMPGLDGESLLRALPRDVPIVVISASPDFGAKSYEFNVVDYLVKPLEFTRFYQAVTKARERVATRAPATATSEIFVKDGTRIVKVDLKRVLFVKAEASYVDFVTDDQSFLSLLSMKKLEEILPDEFIRVHRSYIVNRGRIARIEDGMVIIGKHKIPISQSHRDELIKRLNVIN